jgi:hypothetical protein
MTDEHRELLDVMMQAIGHALADVHTATIARITAVGGETISCRPVTARVVNGESIPLPEFVDVPVLVLQGGGSYTAYPIAAGDYALLIFTERAFDRWWNGQDDQPPPELRMHDYSDGIAVVGLNPLGSAISIPSTIKQNGDTVQYGNYTQYGNRTINGNLSVDGNITCTGTISAAKFSGLGGGSMIADVDIISGGKSLQTHTHPVTTAPGVTGAPS